MNSALNSMQFPDHGSGEEERLAGGLTALADYHTPPSPITVEAVIGAGHRSVRRRRSGTALGTAAVLAITGLGAWGATAAVRGGHTAATVQPVGAGTDPMTPQLAFGYLPGPATGGFGWEESTSRGSTIDVENGTVNVSVTLQRPGEPELRGPYTDAGTVDGHPAVWTEFNSNHVLVWRYQPDAWAFVLAEGANDTEIHKIADTLHIGPQAPIPLPMHLAALPHGFTVSGASATGTAATKGNTGGGFTLCYRGNCDTNGLSIVARIDFPLAFQPGNASAASRPAGGHAGTIVQVPGSPVFETIHIDGLTVMATATGTAVQAIGGESGLTAFVKSMTWYGSDPAKWTTNVIG